MLQLARRVRKAARLKKHKNGEAHILPIIKRDTGLRLLLPRCQQFRRCHKIEKNGSRRKRKGKRMYTGVFTYACLKLVLSGRHFREARCNFRFNLLRTVNLMFVLLFTNLSSMPVRKTKSYSKSDEAEYNTSSK